MKVRIQKLGNIQDSTFDLKPLTIFVGPNNMGKTWLAYTLSAIFGPVGLHSYVQAYVEDQLPRAYPPLDDAIEQVLTKGNANIDLYSLAEIYGEKYFNNVADLASAWMPDFMSSQYPHFENIHLSIVLDEMKAAFLKSVRSSSFRSNVSKGVLNIRKKAEERIVYAYTASEDENNDEQVTNKLPDEEIRKLVISRVIHTIHRALYPQVRVFPAERTAIVTFNFGKQAPGRSTTLSNEKVEELIQMLEKIVQDLQIENINRARAVIGPVGTFMSMLSDLFEVGPREIENRKRAARNNSSIQKYCDLADILEKEILAGKLTFSTTEPDRRRDILFQPVENTNLEISIASSMVKELSSLVLYLRYLAKPGELVIIDEPEMNLHPLAQVKIIEFLAALVNAELNVLITTHSTYLVDHLGNLMSAYKHERKHEIIEKFMLEREDAFIDQNMVSVCEITEHGTIKNILEPDGAINWQTFSDVTDLVQRIHFEL